MNNYNKTLIKKTNETKWYIVDGKNKNLGRLSSNIAYILQGKNRKEYLPFKENKIKIIIINSKHIQVTGKKNEQKIYKRHSGRPGGLKTELFHQLQERIPNKIIEHAIKGMLPKNSLGRQLFKNLKIYSDNQHPHEAQTPTIININ